LIADLAASLLLCLISSCPVEVQPIAGCRHATEVLLTGYWTVRGQRKFFKKKSSVWHTLSEMKWYSDTYHKEFMILWMIFTTAKFEHWWIRVRDIIGVLKGTLWKACVVEVGDGDIMDVPW